jgi:RND family efflux transporter MFP subunit
MLAAVVAGCGGDEAGGAQAAQPGGSGGGGGRGGRPGPNAIIPVETIPVEHGKIARSVTVSGTVEPIRTVGVNAQLSGALRTVVAEEGTFVQEGAVLATLDDREISAQLASAEAAYQLAEANFQRAERLRERQVITAPEYERDRAALAAASAQREQLRTRVGYATVNAPLTGMVTEKNVEAGDVVGVQTRLFTIADLSTMVVRVRVSELDVVQLSQNDRADVVLDAVPGRLLAGRIRRVFPSADPASRLVPVEVAITGQDARVVRPGFLARVTFALGAKENVLLVPASAIVKDASGAEALYVIADNRAQRRIIRTGLISEGRVEILEGAQAGDIIVVTGTNNLRDGSSVRVVSGPAARPQGRLEGGNPQ